MAGTTKAQIKAYKAKKNSSVGGSRGGSSSPKESVDQTVARARAMLDQTKAEGSKSFAGSSYESDYKAGKYNTAISATDLNPVSPINLPEKKQADPGIFAPSITPQMQDMGFSLGQTGYDFARPPIAEDNADQVAQRQQQNFAGYLQQVLGNKPTDLEKDFLKREKQAGIQQLQDQVGNYTGQLNQIIAQRDASVLSLEGQGRGQTEGFIGGEQARINREAAIAALPVQAALDAAQGNLAMAQQRVDKLFAIHREDAQNEYNWRSGIINAVYDFSSKQEQQRLDQINQREQLKLREKEQNLSLMNQWAQMAVNTGQSNLIQAFTSIDPNDPMFTSKFGKLQAQVQNPVSSSGGAQDWSLFNQADGTTVMYNQRTGETRPMAAGTTGAAGGFNDPTNLEAKYTALLADIGDATALANSGAVGAGMIERGVKGLFTSNADFAQVQNIADTIKANLLTLNTDPAIKKFFGPQMSNRDTELMTGAASTLNPDKQTPDQFKRDLQDAAELIARARQAVAQANGLNMSLLPLPIVTAPNGMQIQIIDE